MSSPVRSLVLWFPDWPVTAYLRDTGSATQAVAIVEKNRVVASSAAARSEGVRRGQRRRDAQARCPALDIVPADPVRDHRMFAPVVTRIEQVAPGVQLIRPGLCALRARGPARYYGGERAAARAVLDGIGDLIARAGVADGLFAAELAARTQGADPIRVVAEGDSADFLAPFSIAALDDAELTGLLARLGVQTLGEFAALGAERVRERFGERGIRLHALAAGRDPRRVEPRTPPPELHREIAFDPPLELAEQVGFAVRQTAEAFLAALGAAHLVCTELRVRLDAEGGRSSERVWLHPGSFDAVGIVDRVRWQLAESDDLGGGIARVRIVPEAVDAASHHAPAIFGSGSEERVHHALSRVQAMLGHRGVLTPAVGGGRWLAERQVLVPWGDRAVLAKERARPWPGSLPDPLPATVFAGPRPVEVTAASGTVVSVDERGGVSASPAVLTENGRGHPIEAWAGPWPIVERTWDAARTRRAHRFQVVDADGVAWLLVCDGGNWSAEGRYD